MANNKPTELPSNRNLINKLAVNVRDGIASMYSKSYYAKPSTSADIKNIKNRLNTSINTIVSGNMDTIGEPNISKLLSRSIKDLNGDKKMGKSIEDFFSDSASMDSLLQSYMENKQLVDLDQEIDVILKYMPKLLEALETKKDNVLSADHFAKDFIYMKNSTTLSDPIFSERMSAIKEKYNLLQETENWYMNTSKYGEQFLWIIPYKQAIGKLLDRRNDSVATTDYTTVGRVTESTFVTIQGEGAVGTSSQSYRSILNEGGITVEFDQSGMLTELVLAKYQAVKSAMIDRTKSLSESFEMQMIYEAAIEAEDGKEHAEGEPIVKKTTTSKKPSFKGQQLIDPKELDLSGLDDEIKPNDGFYDPTSRNKKDSKNNSANNLIVPGCIVKPLKREMVKLIYEEDVCIGYLYIELRKGETFKFNNSIFDRTTPDILGKDISSGLLRDDKTIDKKLSDLANQVSKFIDSKFINSNIDLTKEIYVLLKHSDAINNPQMNVRVSFLPAEDVVHIKFREDPDTHRGISDLKDSLFPAKIWCAMTLVNSIANMTRGFDRRVYYVKQAVDTNVAKNLLNTINQIKKSNFNIRQIENINNIIGIAGCLHDFLIPTLGGDPPIQIETIPGQKFDPPTEILQMLEEMAINVTDVPLELIQMRSSVDYAVHYTMTNSKFLRKVFNRQSVYSKYLSVIISKIYDYEYGSTDKIKVTLPPPLFLNISNTSQIINNTSEFAKSVADIYMPDTDSNPAVKSKFLRNLQLYYLGSYIETDQLEHLKSISEQEATIKQPGVEEQ